MSRIHLLCNWIATAIMMRIAKSHDFVLSTRTRIFIHLNLTLSKVGGATQAQTEESHLTQVSRLQEHDLGSGVSVGITQSKSRLYKSSHSTAPSSFSSSNTTIVASRFRLALPCRGPWVVLTGDINGDYFFIPHYRRGSACAC